MLCIGAQSERRKSGHIYSRFEAGFRALTQARRSKHDYSKDHGKSGIMGKVYDGIDDTLARFIAAQHMFFVATAPLDPAGNVNLSPKGLTFASARERKDRHHVLRLPGRAEDIAALRPGRGSRTGRSAF
jgi:hypothetical protein